MFVSTLLTVKDTLGRDAFYRDPPDRGGNESGIDGPPRNINNPGTAPRVASRVCYSPRSRPIIQEVNVNAGKGRFESCR